MNHKLKRIGLAIVCCVFAQGLAQDNTVTIEPTCTVEGDVLDATGRTPVAGAEIAAIAQQNFKTNTDTRGHFVLKGIKPGDYALYAKKEHYALGAPRRVILVPGAVLQHFDLQLQKESAVSGRVLDESKNPVANAQIDAWVRVFRDGRKTFSFAGAGKTDKQGRYKVSGLSKGDYYIVAGLNSFAVKAIETELSEPKEKMSFAFRSVFYGGGPYAEGATPVHLQVSEQREGADFLLKKVRTFCATGIASLSSPLPGETSVALHLAEISAGWTHTIGDGEVPLNKKFQICGLIQGDVYTLFATLWQSDADVAALGRVQFSGNQRDADLGIDLGVLSLQTARPVKGKVVIKGQQSGDQVPEGVRVAIEPAFRYGVQNESRSVDVEPSGNFLLKSVLPDEHWLRVLGLPPGYYLEKATFRGLDLLHEPFSPEESEIEISISSNGSAVSGRVLDKENRAVQEAIIILAPKDLMAGSIKTRHVNQYGDFRFPADLRPGDYRIVAIVGLLEREAEDPDRANEYLSHGKTFSLPPGGHQNLTLTPVSVD